MALTTEHISASERLNPAFPQPGTRRWGLWWMAVVAVVAALATATTLVVTLVVSDDTNQARDHALVDVGFDAKDHRGYNPAAAVGFDAKDHRGYNPAAAVGFDAKDHPGYNPAARARSFAAP